MLRDRLAVFGQIVCRTIKQMAQSHQLGSQQQVWWRAYLAQRTGRAGPQPEPSPLLRAMLTVFKRGVAIEKS